jgi:hypothetical protein
MSSKELTMQHAIPMIKMLRIVSAVFIGVEKNRLLLRNSQKSALNPSATVSQISPRGTDEGNLQVNQLAKSDACILSA